MKLIYGERNYLASGEGLTVKPMNELSEVMEMFYILIGAGGGGGNMDTCVSLKPKYPLS